MRLIAGGIMHETHTFSAEPTTLESLNVVARGDELLAFAGRNHSLGGVIDACRERGIELAPAFFADGVSTGVPDRQTFETLAGELCEPHRRRVAGRRYRAHPARSDGGRRFS